jgi:uncharacterized Tic20 family protein
LNTLPHSDEKIIAALAHGSVLFAFLGPIAPVAIWASQRKKSKYVCFHALQAMGYQALMFWLWIAVILLFVTLTVCLAFPLSISLAKDTGNAAAAPVLVQFFMFIFMFGMIGLFFLAGIIAAVSCLLGRDFRYPLIGKWLERHLPYDAESDVPMDETQEDNWVAGVCHATAILQLWGIITPLIVWFTQKERSARLRFQSMQAVVYQGIALVAYLAGMVLYMVVFFGMFFIPLVAAGLSRSNEIPAPAGIVVLVFMGIMMIFWLVFTLLVPIYYLLAGIASLRSIQGRSFRYPIIGKILEKRMQPSQLAESTP